MDTVIHALSSVEHSEPYGFNDNQMANKRMMFFVEFDIEVDSLDDLEEVVRNDLNGFYVRIMTMPNTWDGNTSVTIRVDFETSDQVEQFADLIYDLELIDDEEYENFEDLIEVYDGN